MLTILHIEVVVVISGCLSLRLFLDEILPLAYVRLISRRALVQSGLWLWLLPTAYALRPTEFVLFHARLTSRRCLSLLLYRVPARLRRATQSLLLLNILVVLVSGALHNLNGFLVLLHLIGIELVLFEI